MVHGVLIANGDYADVDDVVQEVFLRAMTQLPTLRDPAAFGGWLMSIARHAATDQRRRRARWLPLSTLLRARPRDEAFEVLDKIRRLPATYRETLTLRLIEGMTGPEIAEKTGMTPDSVRVHLHRGMKLLREALR